MILPFNLLKLAFVTNDDLLILDYLFSHLIWSDVMIPYIYILKISIYGMGNFNRLVCNKYEARSVAFVISQYLIVRSEKKSKDTSSSQTLFSDVRNYSG